MKDLTLRVFGVTIASLTVESRPDPRPDPAPAESTTFADAADLADDLRDVAKSPFWHRRR